MDHNYTLLSWISLDGGSWADWFSGTMSALAVMVALIAYPVSSRQRRVQQKKRDKEIGRAIGWKLLRILNHTADIDRHITSSLSSREKTNPPGFKFPLVRPLGVPERPISELNQTEIDLLLKANAAGLLMEIDMCMGRYASIVYSMNQYKIRHEALFELMPAPVANQGTLFTHALSKEQSTQIMPYAIMLDALLDSIIAIASENLGKAIAAIHLYNKEMKRHFGKPLMEFETDGDVAEQQSETVNKN